MSEQSEIEVSSSGNIIEETESVEGTESVEDVEEAKSVEDVEDVEEAESVEEAEIAVTNVKSTKPRNKRSPILRDIDYSMCILNIYDLDLLLGNIRECIIEKRDLSHVNIDRFTEIESYILTAIEDNENAFWKHINPFNIANNQSNIITARNVDNGIKEYTESTFSKTIIYCGHNMYYYALDLFRMSNSPFARLMQFYRCLNIAVRMISYSMLSMAEVEAKMVLIYVSMLNAALFYPETIPARFTDLHKLNISEFTLVDAILYKEARKLLSTVDKEDLFNDVIYKFECDDIMLERQIARYKLVFNRKFMTIDNREATFDISTALISDVFSDIITDETMIYHQYEYGYTSHSFEIYDPMIQFNYQKKICARSDKAAELKALIDMRNSSVDADRFRADSEAMPRNNVPTSDEESKDESASSTSVAATDTGVNESEDIFISPSKKGALTDPDFDTLEVEVEVEVDATNVKPVGNKPRAAATTTAANYTPSDTSFGDIERKAMVKYKQDTSQQQYRESIFRDYARAIRNIQRENPHYVLIKAADKTCIESNYKYKYLNIYRELNADISEELAYKFLIAIASNVYTYFLIFTPEFLGMINQSNYSHRCKPSFEYVIYYANIVANYYEVMTFLKARFGNTECDNVENYSGMLSSRDIGIYCTKHMIEHRFEVDAALLINLETKDDRMINLMICRQLYGIVNRDELEYVESINNSPKSIIYDQITSANIYSADIVKLRLLFLSKGVIDSEFDWTGVNLTGSSFMLAAYDPQVRSLIYRSEFMNKTPPEFDALFAKHAEILSREYTIEKFVYNTAVKLRIDIKNNIKDLVKHVNKYYLTDKFIAPDDSNFSRCYRQGEMPLESLNKVPDSWIDFDFIVSRFSDLESTAHRIFAHFSGKHPQMYIMIQVSSRRYTIVSMVNYLPSADVYYHALEKVMAYHVAGVRGYFNGVESLFAPSCFDFIHTNINEVTRAITTIRSYSIVDKYTDRGVIFTTDVTKVCAAVCRLYTKPLFGAVDTETALEDDTSIMRYRNSLSDTVARI